MPRWITKTLDFFTSGLGPPQSSKFEDGLSRELATREPFDRSNSSGSAVTRSTAFSDDDTQVLLQARRGLVLPKQLLKRWKNRETQTGLRVTSQKDKSTQTEDIELPSGGHSTQTCSIPSCTTSNSNRSPQLDRRKHDLLENSLTETTEPKTPKNSVSYASSSSHELYPETSSGKSASINCNENNIAQGEFEDKGLHVHPPYAKGPLRVIMANDGYENCLAVLLNAELVDKVNQIAARSRRLDQIETKLNIAAQKESMHRDLLKYKEEVFDESEDDKVLQKLQLEMGQHQELMAEARKLRESLEERRKTLRLNLAYSRDQSQEMLEVALDPMDLLGDPEAELEEEEDSYHHSDSEISRVSKENASTGCDRSQTSTIDFDLDEVYRNTVKECYANRKRAIIDIETAFDSREENLAEERAEYQRRVREGTCFYTQTEFDILAVQDFQELTQSFKEAEHAFEEAYKEARALKVLDHQDAHYQESNFSYGSGGYPSSVEDAAKRSAPTSRIHRWLRQLPTLEELSTNGEVNIELQLQADEECEIASAAISGSWSCVDLSRNRKRIDHWREITGRER
ncbi:MAG: hypothetical protein Q9167_004208 [Letrouitia subvulpina]